MSRAGEQELIFRDPDSNDPLSEARDAVNEFMWHSLLNEHELGNSRRFHFDCAEVLLALSPRNARERKREVMSDIWSKWEFRGKSQMARRMLSAAKLDMPRGIRAAFLSLVDADIIVDANTSSGPSWGRFLSAIGSTKK